MIIRSCKQRSRILVELALILGFCLGFKLCGARSLLVTGLGARGDGVSDDTEYFQRALDSFTLDHSIEAIIVPGGRYKITKQLNYSTKGYTRGLTIRGFGEVSEILYTHANGSALLAIDGATQLPYQFQRGGKLSNFRITGVGIRSGASKASQGPAVQIVGWWMFEISQLFVTQVDGDAISFPDRPAISANPDAYASALGKIAQCELSFNRGWGLTSTADVGLSMLKIEHCRIGENGGGGIELGGNANTIVGCSIFSNGTRENMSGGVRIYRLISTPMNIVISSCEFDTNYGYHIRINGGLNIGVDLNRMNSWWIDSPTPKLTPSRHVWIENTAKGSMVRNVVMEANYHRSVGGVAHKGNGALTLYDIASDANIQDVTIKKNFVPEPDNTPEVKLHSQLNPHTVRSISQE